MRKPKTVAELLARGMEKAEEVGECLEWQGPMQCNGKTPVVKSREGKTYTAGHPVCRLLWEQFKGPIPEGLKVYRKCCNNRCVNLDHLVVGTHQQWHDNRKRMGVSGHSPATKLKITAGRRRGAVYSIEKAREVRALAAEMTQEEVARRTGVNIHMVYDIVANRAWRETVASPFAGLFTPRARA